MSKQKGSKLLNLSKFLHRYYNLFFIILFIISLFSFAFIYFYHTNNVEKRFDKALKSYEQSLSNIFNNLSMKTNNYTNESIVPNTSSSCTRERISINNNNIMNMSEGDGFDELKKSFEIGFDLLKASLSEIMKNSNDVLTFWFAFLSVIMVVFTFAGILINNNVLEQSKIQLKFVEKEADQSINNIVEKTKIEIQKIIDENNIHIQIFRLFSLSEKSINSKDYNLSIYYNNEIIKLYNNYINVDDNIKYKKNYSGAYYNIGLAKYYLKEYNKAIQDFNKSIELDPNFSDAYNNMGLSYYELKQYSQSLMYFDKAIQLNNQNSMIYVNRGVSKQQLKDYKGALEDYNEAIKLNPNLSEAYNNRGNTQRILNNINSSIRDFDKAIELNPNNSEAYNNRGLVKKQLKDYEGALKDYNEAIKLNPNKAEFYNNKGVLIKDLNKLNDALSDFDKAIELNPNYSEAYSNRGLLKLQIGMLDNVIEDFNKAIEFNPNYSEAYFNRYISKSLLLAKIVNKNSEEYKKAFDDAYNDLDTAYSLADGQLRAMIKNQVINMAILGNEVAIKFCYDNGWEIKI